MSLEPVVGGGCVAGFWLCDRFKPGAEAFADLGSGCSTRCLTRPGATSTAPSGATSGSLTGTAGSRWQVADQRPSAEHIPCIAEKQNGS